MFGLIKGLFETPLYGVLTLICCAILYLWREQGKIKAESRKEVETLHEKKLDKEDFSLYNETHNEVHKGVSEYLKMMVELLKGGK